MLDFQPRGDSRWVPLSMREGQVFVPRPCGVRDDRADRLERELAELKLSLGQMKEVGWSRSAWSQSVPPTSAADGFGPFGQELQGGGRELQGGGRDRAPGVGKEHVRDGVCHQGHVGVHHSPEPPDDKQYGRWRQEGGQNPMSLPWNEGVGNSKAELAELASNASPIELGDWLAVCGPVMRDLSSVSSRWWNLTLREAQCYYDRWKTSSPLERVQIAPRLPDELLDGCYRRTEQRGVSLLLRAIPADQQQALITARELTSTALLYRLMVRYQPGGSGEKAILLSKLTTLDPASGATDLAAALRSWRRHYARAQEVDAVLPDGTLLLKALEPACVLVASLDAQASFRLAQSRLQLAIDQQPIHQSIWRFSQCLLAEAETLSLMGPSSSTTSPAKVKQLEVPSKAQATGQSAGDKGKGGSTSSSSSAVPCRYFRSDTGCKAGKSCKWSHSWEGIEDKNSRCWICGGKDHRKTECKLKSQQKPSPVKDTKEGNHTNEPGPGSGGGKGSSKGSSKLSSSTAYASTASTTAPIKIQEMEVSSSEGKVGEVQSNEASKGGETGATSTTSEALLQEATKLLKSLRVPQVRVIKLSQLERDAGDLVLLDSGASPCKRFRRMARSCTYTGHVG